MKALRITIALALLGLAVAWFASKRSSEAPPTIGPAPDQQVASSSATDLGDVEPPELPNATATDPARVEVLASNDSTRAAVVSATPKRAIGRLSVRAVDATTNEPLWSFGARLASDTRFADERSHDASGEIELPLTPDTYSIAVFACGYESSELAPVQVTAGETNRLEPVKLRAGVGRITVDVAGSLSSGRSLAVELKGAGRRPCEHCADTQNPKASGNAEATRARAWQRVSPCRYCGFACERSSVSLAAASRCEFANLASGNYAVRVSDDRGLAVCEARELVLRDGESARVDFDLSSRRYVEFEFLDVDGRSMSEEWRLRLADPQEDVEIVSTESGSQMNPIALAFFDDARNPIATASFVPPMPRGSTGFTSIGAGRFSGRRAGGPHASVDRARRPEDTLWPDHAAASFGASSVACDLQDNGLARVGPLPSSRLELHATTEYFAADAIVPASRATTRVTLKLRTTLVDPKAPPKFATYSAYEMAGVK